MLCKWHWKHVFPHRLFYSPLRSCLSYLIKKKFCEHSHLYIYGDSCIFRLNILESWQKKLIDTWLFPHQEFFLLFFWLWNSIFSVTLGNRNIKWTQLNKDIRIRHTVIKHLRGGWEVNSWPQYFLAIRCMLQPWFYPASEVKKLRARFQQTFVLKQQPET